MARRRQARSASPMHTNSGLAHWMMEVPGAVARASAGFKSKPVHDLRVALRRCCSMADGFRAVDPDKAWKKMRRQAKDLFDSLGALRDCQVTLEWVEKLGAAGDPITRTLLTHFRGLEPALKQHARNAIESFDAERWQEWTRLLPPRAASLPAGSETFQTLALERLNTARRLQARALRTGDGAALHRLRIALKKFRYVVENFLPQHADWQDGRKHVQDLLGEVHDLDVLREALLQLCAAEPAEVRRQWEQVLTKERVARIERYREVMSGGDSLWARWRAGLPRGQAARQASLTRLQAWSSFLDSDVQHSRRVARFALRIFDGLARIAVLTSSHKNDRELLRASAVVHEVGRAGGNKGHHKRTESMIGQLNHLAGWTPVDLRTMARVARYHRGALPQNPKLRDLPLAQRQRITLLAGILRLANALDEGHDGAIHDVRVEKREGFVVIHAEGLQAQSALAERIAAARHLLEVTCGLPVLVRPMARRNARRKVTAQLTRSA